MLAHGSVWCVVACSTAWRCYYNNEAPLGMEACLGQGFLQAVVSMLQVTLVSLQVCSMLACICEQELHAFQLAASRLHHSTERFEQSGIMMEALVYRLQ